MIIYARKVFSFNGGFLMDARKQALDAKTEACGERLSGYAGRPLVCSESHFSLGKPEDPCSLLDSRKAGFTLLELLVVLVLASFIAGLSAVFLANMLPSAKLAATARDISATIRIARALAQINGVAQAVTIDLDSKNYSLPGHGTKNIPSQVNVKVADPFAGDVFQGQYTIVAYSSGAVSDCTIVLWYRKKALSIQTDPVVGAVVIK